MGHIYTHLYNSKCLLLYAKIACDILFHVTFSFSYSFCLVAMATCACLVCPIAPLELEFVFWCGAGGGIGVLLCTKTVDSSYPPTSIRSPCLCKSLFSILPLIATSAASWSDG